MALSNNTGSSRGLKGFVKNFIALTRIFEWIDKIWILLGTALILMLYLPRSDEVFLGFLTFGLFTIFTLSYGYAINTFADREVDARAGKTVKVEAVLYFSKMQLTVLFGFLIFGMLGIPFYFDDVRVRALGLVNLFLATFYSMGPIRFKERGFLGILVAGLTQRSFLFLFFALIVPAQVGLSALLFVWLSVVGLLMEIGHQILDFKRDSRGGVQTWATSVGLRRAKNVGVVVFALFILSVLSPLVILPVVSGLMVSFLLISFSAHSVHYFVDAYKGVGV
jgi:4-hydroxybenzoate polyprenyltransferase